MKKVKSLIVLLSVIAVVLLAVSCGDGTPTPRFSNFTLYTVTTKDGDYVIDSVIVIDGNTYSLPVGPDKVGYSFVGWKVGDSIMASGEKITVTEDTEIDSYYAKTYNCIVDYAYFNYTEKYDVPEGTQVKISDWDITKVADQFKVDDTFLGWMLNGEEYLKSDTEKWNSTVTITKDSTMTAKWQKVKYHTVTFYDEDGTTVLFTRKIADDSEIGETHSPYKEGYTLEAWIDKNGDAFDLSTSIKGDMTLKAKWKLTSCVVTLDFDNGAENQKHVVTTGETFYEPKDPVKEGYDFVGWYKDSEKFDFSTPITENITLKANWDHKTTYTVTFDTMGGSEVETKEVTKNNLVFKPSDPTRNGYTFGGWYLADGTAFNFNSTIVTENLTLYALWNLDKEYNIGDTGLGGGKVFYDAGSMQISSYVDKNGVTRIYTWRYLEVNTNVKDKANWANGNVLTELGSAIGQGRSNTMKMARKGSAAANIATSCTDGGVSDWFIPSLNELGALAKVKDDFGLPGAAVWASTSFSVADAYYYNFYTNSYGSQFKCVSWRVGPSINVLLVRAF